MLSHLTEYQLFSLIPLIQEVNYKNDEYIIHKGDKGDAFYIVKKGIAVCYDHLSKNSPATKTRSLEAKDKNKKENLVEIRELHEKEYFGEIALLNDISRTLDVIAKGDTTCWMIKRDDFDRHVGSLKNILDVYYYYLFIYCLFSILYYIFILYSLFFIIYIA